MSQLKSPMNWFLQPMVPKTSRLEERRFLGTFPSGCQSSHGGTQQLGDMLLERQCLEVGERNFRLWLHHVRDGPPDPTLFGVFSW